MTHFATNITNEEKAQSKVIALFVSDIHLSPTLSKTTHAFLDFLKRQTQSVDQLYLLGDLFEYWAGDDDMSSPYNQQVIDALQQVHAKGTQIFWIAGNRDFLIGKKFAVRIGASILPDPSTIQLNGQDYILSHGDAYCTDDIGYMHFRAMVRQAEWQSRFLEKSLGERKQLIEEMRKQSSASQKQKTMEIMDVNQHAIDQLFSQHPRATLIHGHTHRPARHETMSGLRYVLPDWNCDHQTLAQRGGWLSLHDNGQLFFHDLDGCVSASWGETSPAY